MDDVSGFVLALGQMRVEPGAPARTLGRACAVVSEAAEQGAEVVLLPEALPWGWMASAARVEADPVPDGVVCRTLRDAARAAAVYVCTGIVERAGDRLFNAAVLIDPRGDVVLHHRKIHELDIAQHLYARGDRLGVADTPWGRIGLMICADGFADGLAISRSLGLMGASVILSPCAWAVPPTHDQQREPYGQLWRDSYGPVARAFGIWIAGASNVGPIVEGPWAGHGCIGCSMVVDAAGDVVLQGPYGVDAECVLLTRVMCMRDGVVSPRPDGTVTGQPGRARLERVEPPPGA
jgi:predicted amidohydrolase